MNDDQISAQHNRRQSDSLGRRYCEQADRINQIERLGRENQAGLRAVTTCLEGYKSFIDVLRRREEQRAELRQKLIDSLINRGTWAALMVIAAVIWYAVKAWVKNGGGN